MAMDIKVKSSLFMLSESGGREDVVIDIFLILLLTALAFGLAFHPYFFGDELVAQQLAIQNNSSFASIFQGMNSYKPRLFFNWILTLLAQWQVSRLVHAALVAGCMAWINVLLYGVVRYLVEGGRVLAWMLIATVLTSRYGMMFYFDYLSGLIELLSTALLLSVLLLAWVAWRERFEWPYAVGALVAAIFCIFTHERYVAALLAAGFAIALAEWAGPAAKHRIFVVGWAFSLGFIPLLLFFAANTILGSAPITTGTAGQQVKLGVDTVWSALTYAYNVFLGGNYGHEWFWGHYNHLHPVGKMMGLATAAATVLMTTVVALRRMVVWRNRYLGLGFVAVAVALIAVASLTGSSRQEARFMFPVGILATMIWIVMLQNTWRKVAIGLILVTNTIYLLFGTHNSIYNIYSSRAASSLAGSVLGVMPIGKNGLVVGNSDDSWTLIGSVISDIGPRSGAAFSKVNLKSVIHLDPFVAGRALDSAVYDFGLAFYGFGPHRTARYRLVPISTALVLAGVSNVDKLAVTAELGNGETWANWQWKVQPDRVDGAVLLRPGTEGWRAMPSAKLDGRWLVYRARTKDGVQVPMRLQVNWHSKQDNRLLSTTIQVVYPTDTWQTYSTLIYAPQGADVGAVYATLHDGAQGSVEVKSVELR